MLSLIQINTQTVWFEKILTIFSGDLTGRSNPIGDQNIISGHCNFRLWFFRFVSPDLARQ